MNVIGDKTNDATEIAYKTSDNLDIDDLEEQFYAYNLSNDTVQKTKQTKLNYQYLYDIFTFAKVFEIDTSKINKINKSFIDGTIISLVGSNIDGKVEITSSGDITCSIFNDSAKKILFYFRNNDELQKECEFCGIDFKKIECLDAIKEEHIEYIKNKIGIERTITETYFKDNVPIKIEYKRTLTYNKNGVIDTKVVDNKFLFYNSSNGFKNLYNNSSLVYSLDNNKLISGTKSMDMLLDLIENVIKCGILLPIPLHYIDGSYNGRYASSRLLIANLLDYDVVRLGIKQ